MWKHAKIFTIPFPREFITVWGGKHKIHRTAKKIRSNESLFKEQIEESEWAGVNC